MRAIFIYKFYKISERIIIMGIQVTKKRSYLELTNKKSLILLKILLDKGKGICYNGSAKSPLRREVYQSPKMSERLRCGLFLFQI